MSSSAAGQAPELASASMTSTPGMIQSGEAEAGVNPAGSAYQASVKSGLSLVMAAAMLCIVALLNGQPFFYPDTPTYLRGAEAAVKAVAGESFARPWVRSGVPPVNGRGADKPPTPPPSAHSSAFFASTPPADSVAHPPKSLTSLQDRVVLAGRSVYYGALLYGAYLAGSLWVAVLAQAFSVAYLLQLLMVGVWKLPQAYFVGAAGLLGFLTPLGVYTGLLMPDVFAGVAVLAIALLLVYWTELPRKHRVGVSGLLLFSLVAHASHLALAVALLLTGLAWLLLSRLRRRAAHLPRRLGRLSGAGLGVLALCVASALVAEWGFNQAVTQKLGVPPLRLPHPMARLIDMGPGTVYLRQHCPTGALPEVARADGSLGAPAYAACAYLRNFPTRWDDFLFSDDPAKGAFALASPQLKRQMSEEQVRFVKEVLAHDPAGVIKGIAVDVLRQLVSFRVGEAHYGPDVLRMYEGRVPDAVFGQLRQSLAARSGVLNTFFTASSYAAVLASLLVWLARRSGLSAAPWRLKFWSFSGWLVGGVAANAVVCATLASSLDRFQARVVWLLPFWALGLVGLAFIRWQAPRSDESRAKPDAQALKTNGSAPLAKP